MASEENSSCSDMVCIVKPRSRHTDLGSFYPQIAAQLGLTTSCRERATASNKTVEPQKAVE